MTGSAIREFREEWGLTQRELAVELGVTSVTVSRWESGGVQPHTSFMATLSNLKKKPSAAMRKKKLAITIRCGLSCVKT